MDGIVTLTRWRSGSPPGSDGQVCNSASVRTSRFLARSPPAMTTTFLTIGSEDADCTILLAHGAGAAMDSPAMSAMAEALASEALRVRAARVRLHGRATRRRTSQTAAARRTPSRGIPRGRPGPALQGPSHHRREVDGRPRRQHCRRRSALRGRDGTSLSRMPVSSAGEAGAAAHGASETPENTHANLPVTRDPFGTFEEVSGYELSPSIEVFWLEDGDHDLRPRKSVSGVSAADHMATMAHKVAAWARTRV